LKGAVPIGAQEEAVDCGDGSPNVDTVDRLDCRWHRRLAKGKGSGSLRRITVFVGHEHVVRLLEFLGCKSE